MYGEPRRSVCEMFGQKIPAGKRSRDSSVVGREGRRHEGREEHKRSRDEAWLIEFCAAWRGQGSAGRQTPLEWRLCQTMAH